MENVSKMTFQQIKELVFSLNINQKSSLLEELKLEINKSEKNAKLTNQEKVAVRKGIEDFTSGKTFTHDEVIKSTAEKYPFLFNSFSS